METQPPAVAADELSGNMIRGGKLYDDWWTEAGVEPPSEDHPLWKTQTTNTRKGSGTWRCAECHGWDYKGVDGDFASGSHMTGFAGILADKGKPPAEILAALKGSTNPDHDFSTVMEEQDLVDLALFVSEGTIDVNQVFNADGTPKGVAADGKEKFEEICSDCHGPQGNAINFKTPGAPEFLAHPANENPKQFLHRTRFGVAVWPMPSAIENEFSDQDLANVIAYAQTLPEESDVTGGGQLYDKWYTVLAVDTPTEDQPLWKNQTTNTRKGVSTWTCRECHGLDYLGPDGVYGSGDHMTGFPGIFASAAKSEQELFDALTGKPNPDHDFSQLMEEGDLNALVHFIKNEMVAIAPLITPDGKIKGDMAKGKEYFNATCAQCHGEDGRMINFHTEDEPEYVGTVAADEPQVLLHRVLYGVPGFPMTVGILTPMTMEDLANVCAYAQTLPVK
jgi:mono/diheme cytochrome c family protein